MHQSLLARSDLAEDERNRVWLELATDFFKAGLLDRAEESLSHVHGDPFRVDADRMLLEIHETARDWPRAIATAERLRQATGSAQLASLTRLPRDLGSAVINYRCELADQAMASQAFEEARQTLDGIVSEHGETLGYAHPRVALLRGQLALKLGDLPSAIDAWKPLESHAADFLALTAAPLASFTKQPSTTPQQRAEVLRLLDHYDQQRPSVDLLLARAELTEALHGAGAALDLLQTQTQQRPSILALEALLKLEVRDASPQRREELGLTLKLLNVQGRKLSRFACSSCGFKARAYYWRCPGCNAWDTYPPKRSEELENPA